jgi:hypothetical protein
MKTEVTGMKIQMSGKKNSQNTKVKVWIGYTNLAGSLSCDASIIVSLCILKFHARITSHNTLVNA